MCTQSNNTEWIRLSDKLPTVEDLPIELYDEREVAEGLMKHLLLTDSYGTRQNWNSLSTSWTHWKKVQLSEPPPAPKTQLDLDDEAFGRWGVSAPSWYTRRDAWHAALAYSRNQDKKA